jgi:hypothetical protein
MPKTLRALVFVLVVHLGTPGLAAASGWDIIRWFDRLSGPDGFNTIWGLELTPFCRGDVSGVQDFDATFNCHRMDRSKLRIEIGGRIARLDGRNTLPYPPGVTPPDVHAVPVMAVVNVGLPRGFLGFSRWDVVEPGAAIGLVRFYGEGYGFNRFAVEPRVTFKPLLLFGRPTTPREQQLLEVVQVRLSGVAIPGSIRAADFNATGSFRAGSEFIAPVVSVLIDFTALLH